ncbi:MAG: flagellar FlbD family protein [Desulfuromonadales bacterium]|nr:flagellar FlbD family protein [Desulfuromonadales bacterium]
MIFLTRMDRQTFYINPDHIVSIEETPDTVITLFNDHHFIVKEPARVIIDKIIAFRSRIIRRSGATTGKKHRAAQRQKLFGNVTLNSDAVISGKRHNRNGSPLHTRDF